MASSGREKPRKAQGQGIRINSSLIATGTTHNEEQINRTQPMLVLDIHT